MFRTLQPKSGSNKSVSMLAVYRTQGAQKTQKKRGKRPSIAATEVSEPTKVCKRPGKENSRKLACRTRKKYVLLGSGKCVSVVKDLA